MRPAPTSVLLVLLSLLMGPVHAQTLTPSVPPAAMTAGGLSLSFTAPTAADIVSGSVDVAVRPMPEDAAWASVTIYADGREICVVTTPPWRCEWDAGTSLGAHHLRAVAKTTDGRRAIGNVRTRTMALDEAVLVDAVQVPVLVTDARGTFVRALGPEAFAVLEEGRPQRIESLVTEAMPLDLVLAVDISTSMDAVIGDVQEAVKRLLTRLRDGDTSTVLGFNDTLFLLSERETDPARRLAAVDGLVTWGGTALFDATVKAIDLVRQRKGRRGAIVFSDGADRHSAGDRETTLQRIQESDVVLYTVGFGQQASPALRETLEDFARASGGRAFFPARTSELDAVFDSILEELSNQYVLSYVSTHPEAQGWRGLDVQVRCDGCRVRAREGYRRTRP